MSENGKPPQAPRLSPYLTVRSAEAALDFYEKAFGFTRREVMKGEDGRVQHAEMMFHESLIMFAPEGAFGNTCKAPASSGSEPPIGLYVYCADVDALFARAKAAGAKVFKEPADMFWGDRMCAFEDPDGYRWSFATHKGAPAGHK
jgi:uncharacterized glyoxalase superfamily protein PhnB